MTPLIPLAVLAASIVGLYLLVIRPAHRGEFVSEKWCTDQQESEIRAVGQIQIQASRGGVTYYQHADDARVRAVAAAVDDANDGKVR